MQRLAAGIDKGTPIVEKTIPILKEDNVSSLSARAMAQSTDMMHDALCLIQRPNYRPAVIEKYGIDAIVTAATDKPLVMMARMAEIVGGGFVFYAIP